MLWCSGVKAGSCVADRHGSGVGRGWRMRGGGGECGARPCCWPRQSRGLAVLVTTGLVDVAPGLVGVALGLVGVTLRLVGVTSRLVGVAPGLMRVEQEAEAELLVVLRVATAWWGGIWSSHGGVVVVENLRG
ncbi:hypothetical protein EDB89DRAFT_1911599 [Lactarius sanguifluus]|nr:hypothetical protein EDB89DRAFT_1911599 [Lactarius sanguifluus]